MTRHEGLEWMNIAAATTALAVESAGVIGLRVARATSGGPNASEEAWRMYSEKLTAFVELQGNLLVGALGATPATAISETVKHYRRKVAANWRRLNKS